MNKPEPSSGRDRVAKRRAALRAAGLRPKQIWVPDLRDSKVLQKIHEACQRIAESPHREDDLAFAEEVQYWPPDDPD